MSTVIFMQWCRKAVKSAWGGGEQHFGLCFISCSLHLQEGLGTCPPESVLVLLCSETAFRGKYLLNSCFIDEMSLTIMSKSVWGEGGGSCPGPLHAPLSYCCGTLLHCIDHANGEQFLHQPVHDHYQPFLIYSDLKIDS